MTMRPTHLTYQQIFNNGVYYTPLFYVEKVWKFIEPYLKKNSVILDPACGTGNFFYDKQNLKNRIIGNDIDRNLLEEIANKTKGKYFFIHSPNELKKVFNTIDRLEKSEFKVISIINHYYYEYPLFLAIILMIIYIRNFRRESWSF